MNPAHLLAHFDRISEAPDAIPRLRRFILDLAARGQLVEQKPRDEPATELLKRIQAKKERIAKTGAIRSEHLLPQVEICPYEIPKGWEWTRLGNTGHIFNGNSVSESKKADLSKVTEGYPFIATKDVGYGRDTLAYENGIIVPFDAVGFKVAHAHAVLICAEGGSAGKKNGQTDRDICFGNKLYANEVWPGIHPRFILFLYQTSFFSTEFTARMTGIIGGIARSEFLMLPVPIPPESEQQRIVAKVDELMALCDRLQAVQTERESRRDRLMASALHRLNNGTDPDGFRDHARFYFNHLPRLTTSSEHIQQLRQTILNLAIWGKLVTQDPNDEPASELLKRVQTEKMQLIESGDITKNEKLHIKAKPIPPDYCPSGWNWVRLRDVIWCYRGHNPPKSDFVTSARPGYVRFIQITDFKTDSMAVYVPITRHLKMVYRGEIIMAAYRHVGKVSRHVEGAFNVALCKVNEIGPMNRDFIELLIGTDLVRGELLRASERGHIPSMHSDHLLSLWVPIPPQLEQKRILEKYAELMALCDKLETQLTTTHTESRRLLEAVLHEALSGREDRQFVNR